MSSPEPEMTEVFLVEASGHLQYLREYSSILQDAYPATDDLERLYVAAHTLVGSAGLYGFPLLSEIAAKLGHIYQYTLNAGISTETSAPLLEFIYEAIATLESDLLMISANSVEAEEEIAAFKEKYPFAFQVAASEPTQTAPEEPTTATLQTAVTLECDLAVPSEVLEFFIPEVEEHLQTVTECLLALETNAGSDDIHRLFRAMHTIKGSAAQVGLHRLSQVAHRTEDLIGRIRDRDLSPSASIIDICLESVDVLKKFLYSQWSDDTAMQSAVSTLLSRIAPLAPEETENEPLTPSSVGELLEAKQLSAQSVFAEQRTSSELAEETQQVSDEEEVPNALTKAPASNPPSKSVRISLDRLDRMMNAVGELVINRTRMLGRVAELERLAEVLNFSKARMTDKVGEFQEKYEFNQLPQQKSREAYTFTSFLEKPLAYGATRSPFPPRRGLSAYSSAANSSLSEFGELELDRYDEFNILSRSLTEISADITEVLSQLDGFVRRVDSDIDEFTKLAHRLQDEITQSRMVPIGNLYTRIARTVRDAAKAADKQVELHLEGAETELDNNIIQQIGDPLLHLVRNAIAHGIERPDERYQNGKTDVGNVVVRAYHHGNHIYIEVEDDGRGVDHERVRATATDLGLITAEQATNLNNDALLDLIFHPGFSTAPRKTELAGRGVGLDVVRANVAALNGEIEVDTQKGLGTRFTLKVPLTLIISQALFVRCGQTHFALPLSFVEEIRRISDSEIEEVGGKLLTKVRDAVTEIIRLDVELGLEPMKAVNGFYRLVLVKVDGRQVGLLVEEVLRKDEIVIKNLGEYLRNVKLFPGATIAPDGSLILIIDVNRLVTGEVVDKRPLLLQNRTSRVFAPGSQAIAAGAIPSAAISEPLAEKLIVLADDSISVRKFVGRMLEKAGYRVKLASDGLDALEIISQGGCDLVITDLEMPRTNGYELMMHLRQNENCRSIPVMVVTSRAGAKHRERALAEGASGFLVKPVQEDQLLASVAEMISGETRRVEVEAASGVVQAR